MSDAGTGALLTARVTHLEMLAPPPHRVPMPTGPKLALMSAPFMPLAFYRYLYEQVGRAHHWLQRRSLTDAALAAVIHADDADISVLYVDGAPAGFFDLTPDFQGRGLAKFFLSEAVFAAWAREPARLVIQTNTLDSPRALQLYQRIGFSPYAFSEETVEPWAPARD